MFTTEGPPLYASVEAIHIDNRAIEMQATMEEEKHDELSNSSSNSNDHNHNNNNNARHKRDLHSVFVNDKWIAIAGVDLHAIDENECDVATALFCFLTQIENNRKSEYVLSKKTIMDFYLYSGIFALHDQNISHVQAILRQSCNDTNTFWLNLSQFQESIKLVQAIEAVSLQTQNRTKLFPALNIPESFAYYMHHEYQPSKLSNNLYTYEYDLELNMDRDKSNCEKTWTNLYAALVVNLVFCVVFGGLAAGIGYGGYAIADGAHTVSMTADDYFVEGACECISEYSALEWGEFSCHGRRFINESMVSNRTLPNGTVVTTTNVSLVEYFVSTTYCVHYFAEWRLMGDTCVANASNHDPPRTYDELHPTFKTKRERHRRCLNASDSESGVNGTVIPCYTNLQLCDKVFRTETTLYPLREYAAGIYFAASVIFAVAFVCFAFCAMMQCRTLQMCSRLNICGLCCAASCAHCRRARNEYLVEKEDHRVWQWNGKMNHEQRLDYYMSYYARKHEFIFGELVFDCVSMFAKANDDRSALTASVAAFHQSQIKKKEEAVQLRQSIRQDCQGFAKYYNRFIVFRKGE